MNNWKPFSTAPKLPRTRDEGPRILVYGARGYTIAYWRYGNHPGVEGWWVDLSVCPAVLKDPIYWMPLPETPKDAEMGWAITRMVWSCREY